MPIGGICIFWPACRHPLSYSIDADDARRPSSRLHFHRNSPIAAEPEARGTSPGHVARHRRACRRDRGSRRFPWPRRLSLARPLLPSNPRPDQFKSYEMLFQ
ncbi:hypothetical protein EVAR_97057_1 [Eumeta japonica]|uniref:Uncharacterized protein n=1 Tax=Eumeta variegata TaxID=151549 RepID=A0A4C1WN92_EUMVA|nr:hypothetical protein EVAR_97057_1 [Eumeta japonica]